jgi:GTPase SAR1 family protein
MGEVVATAPTVSCPKSPLSAFVCLSVKQVGSNQELFTYKNMQIRLWDIGGQTQLRQSWSQYYAKTKAVILVVDSTDRERLDIAKSELHNMCADEMLKDSLLLVMVRDCSARKTTGG